ncbi:hypothetical protein [Solidesulfovibrio sp. C21]|uniref:hypothetical protein n=1 Tax=Solidesulfovibrio sp. C21 TaxID=3398613 RepID=UPI0039FCE384
MRKLADAVGYSVSTIHEILNAGDLKPHKLNQVEIWFNIFTKDVLKGGIWKSRQALVSQIMTYIRRYNEQRAHPFKWTYEGKPLSS